MFSVSSASIVPSSLIIASFKINVPSGFLQRKTAVAPAGGIKTTSPERSVILIKREFLSPWMAVI